ncbi:MAG: LytTR family transcriptional regulator DNA-binding domain-containing protein [Flavobacteriales bacterium]
MRALLARPYPLEPATRRHIGKAVLFGLFVAAFLLVFRPFGLHNAPEMGVLAAAYGATCTATMLLLNVALPRVLAAWFDEARWTVGRELGWTLLNVAAIGLANALLSTALGLAPLTLVTLGLFTLFTVLIGLFPITLSVLLTEARRSRTYATDSAAINADLHQHAPPAQSAAPASAPGPSALTLPNEAGPALLLGADALLFARAADNYVEVFHLQAGQPRRTVLRNSLKALGDALQPHGDRFLRCHKSHLVDLHKVQRVSGNAQGLRLHLSGVEEPIPVSRQLTSTVRERLADRRS